MYPTMCAENPKRLYKINPRSGSYLPQQTRSPVQQLYLSDEVSRVMAVRKDYVSVRQEGKRIHVQNNLCELNKEFKGKFPDLKIRFSKFAELRPKQCVIDSSSGTHCVCMCTIPQNVKLMLNKLHLSELPSYHNCLLKIMCNPPSPSCRLGECSTCPDIQIFKEGLIQLLDRYDID